jgi:hypothetical protein
MGSWNPFKSGGFPFASTPLFLMALVIRSRRIAKERLERMTNTTADYKGPASAKRLRLPRERSAHNYREFPTVIVPTTAARGRAGFPATAQHRDPTNVVL